jgi:hypothetical protein
MTRVIFVFPPTLSMDRGRRWVGYVIAAYRCEAPYPFSTRNRSARSATPAQNAAVANSTLPAMPPKTHCGSTFPVCE